jgi:hypothetical protein
MYNTDDKGGLRSVQFMDSDFRKATQTLMRRICVMVGYRDGAIAVRDSKDPARTTLIFNRDEWNAFIKGVKDGEFDLGDAGFARPAPQVAA